MEISYSRQALKNIKLLNEPHKSKIRIAIEKIPLGDIKRLQGYKSMFRLRVGDYRIVYKTIPAGIYIEAVLPRGEAYKRDFRR